MLYLGDKIESCHVTLLFVICITQNYEFEDYVQQLTTNIITTRGLSHKKNRVLAIDSMHDPYRTFTEL